jgi:hypothetical protein
LNIATRRARALISAISCATLAANAASGVVLTVDPAQSTVDAELTVSIVSDTDTLQFSGTMISDSMLVTDPTFGVVVDNIQVTSADLGLSDGAWSLYFFLFVDVLVDSMDLRATASSDVILGTPVAMNTSEFELQGSVLTFNQGVVVATGSALGSSIDVNNDLSVTPLEFPFEDSTIATVVVTEAGGDVYDIDVTIPVEASVIALEDPEVVTLNLSNGQIVLTGTVIETENPVPTLGEWRTLGLMLLLVAVGSAILHRRRSQHA